MIARAGGTVNLKHLTDQQLIAATDVAAKVEVSAMTHLLHHLAEIQRRRLFSVYAVNSLFEYCVKRLKMSEPAASRRVNAVFVLMDVPEIGAKLQSGELSLSNVSQAQTFFNQEARMAEALTSPEKARILKSIENKGARRAKEILVASSSIRVELPKEGMQPISAEFHHLTAVIDEETKAGLERLQEIWSHSGSQRGFGAMLKKMTELCLSQVDPLKKSKQVSRSAKNSEKSASRVSETEVEIQSESATRVETETTTQSVVLDQLPTPTSESARSRHIPARVRHAVQVRDGGSCAYIDGCGDRCSSRTFVQFHHLIPFACSGEHTVENIELRCFSHNQRHAIDDYGTGVLSRGELRP